MYLFCSPKREDCLNRLDFNSLNRLLISVSLVTQGRYYLSAETLIDMKNWVSRIRAAIRNINRKKEAKQSDSSGPSLGPVKMEAACNEPEYASIKDYPRFVSR